MIANTVFEFGSIDEHSSAETYVARVPPGLTSTYSLLSALRDSLRFPDYFGLNWNALSDCLRDFHWLSQRAIVLVHDDLPGIPESDLALYLDVLAEAVRSWRPEEGHSLRVLFPTQARAHVLRAARPQ